MYQQLILQVLNLKKSTVQKSINRRRKAIQLYRQSVAKVALLKYKN